MGERLADLGTETLARAQLSTAQYREAALLYEAAQRLAPGEVRFPRLRYEASLQCGETSDAIAALIASSKLDPSDFQAQIKLIELYAQRMETAEAKLKYLRDDLLPIQAVPTEIRSHAALLASRMLLERGERREAATLASESVRLNPYNAEAQRLRFELSLREGTAVERLGGLLAIVRASPLDPGAVGSVARELDEAGLDESSAWYDASVGLSLRANIPPARSVIDDYAARLMIIGTQREMRDAESIITRIVQADPGDPNAQLIRAAIGRIEGNPAANAKQLQEARAALIGQLRDAASALGVVSPATRPDAPVLAPDPSEWAIRAAADTTDPQIRAGIVRAAADLAFFELFFQNDATTPAVLIEAIRKVEPANSSVLARLDGWTYLVQKKDAEARQKLSAIEASDPLASLGMLRLETDKEPGEARARTLRATAHGTIGALVASELATRRTPYLPSRVAAAMQQLLSGFPTELLRLIDSPQNFYLLRAEPVTTVGDFGDPMLVRVTVVNVSNFDLPLGPRGAIRPDLWVDVTIRGLHPADFPNVAFDRLAGPLVLRPKQAASRVVRVDQGRLLRYSRETPYYSIPITGNVCTNPISPAGRAVPGPGGQQVQFSRLMEQSPVPFYRPEQRDTLIKALSTAAPDRRPALIEAAQVYVKRAADENQPEAAAQLRAALDALYSDPDLTARSWGTFLAILNASGDLQVTRAKSASADPYWLLRLLSLVAIRKADASEVRALSTQLSADSEPIVARYARATLDELSEPAAPTPATRP